MSRLALALATLGLACGPDEPAASSSDSSSSTTTAASTGPESPTESDPGPACGDGLHNDAAPCLVLDEVHPLDDHYHDLVVGDFDGDGARELLGAWSGFISNSQGELRALALSDGVYRGTTRLQHDGHFTSLFVDDVDRDGRDDVLALTGETQMSGDTGSPVSAVRWLRSAGAAEFVATSGTRTPNRASAMAADIDGDGRLELVVLTPVDIVDSEYWNRAFVYRDFAPDPDGFLVSHQSFATPLDLYGALADLDADGHPDLIGVDPDGRASTWAGTASGTFEPRWIASADLSPADWPALLAGDLDADGRAELLRLRGGPEDGTTAIDLAVQAEDRAFSVVKTLPVDATPTTTKFTSRPHALLLDLDGSGRPALVLAADGEPRLVVFPQVGVAQGDGRLDLALAHPADGLFAADLEGDGRLELLIIELDDEGNSYLQVVRVDP